MERKNEAPEKEFKGEELIAALNEWKDASKDRKLFAVLEDEDGSMAIMGRGEALIKSLACALANNDRAFFICKSALDFATFVKNATEAKAKGLEEK